MKGRLSLVFGVVALSMLCGCSSYEVTSSNDQEPISSDYGVALGTEPGPTYTTVFMYAPPGHVRLELLSITGYMVRLFIDEEHPGGRWEYRWDYKKANGEKIMSGVYILRLETGGRVYAMALPVCWTDEECDKLTKVH